MSLDASPNSTLVRDHIAQQVQCMLFNGHPSQSFQVFLRSLFYMAELLQESVNAFPHLRHFMHKMPMHLMQAHGKVIKQKVNLQAF